MIIRSWMNSVTDQYLVVEISDFTSDDAELSDSMRIRMMRWDG